MKSATATADVRAEAEAIMERLARAANGLKSVLADLDAEIIEARARYEPQISAYQAEAEAAEKCLKALIKANRSELLGDAQSVSLLHGECGFRVSPPSLALVGKRTWDQVMTDLCLLKREQYLRQIIEPDRAKLLCDRDDLGPEFFESIGCRISQRETFYADPKEEAPQ